MGILSLGKSLSKNKNPTKKKTHKKPAKGTILSHFLKLSKVLPLKEYPWSHIPEQWDSTQSELERQNLMRNKNMSSAYKRRRNLKPSKYKGN